HGTPELAKALGRFIVEVQEHFAGAVNGLAATSICKCEACGNIGKLKLKIIAHSGEAVLSRFGELTELTGVDVLLLHRLLKNGIEGNEYVFLTESARADIALPTESNFVAHREEYEDVGVIMGGVWHNPVSRASDGTPHCEVPPPDDRVAVEILRFEIQKE